MILLLVYVAALGLVLGSFGNVVIYRVPLGQSLVSPGSRCPHCEHGIRYRDNLPVLSWLALRGRCRDCAAAIAGRYPLVEIGTAVLFVAITVRLHELGALAALPAYLYFAVMGIVLALIDFDTRRLPDVIVLPSYGVLVILLAGGAARQSSWLDLERAVVGGAALFLFYYLVALAYPAGIGFGDVKLSGLLGGVLAFVSWGTLVVGAFAGFLLGAIVGVAMMAFGRATRRSSLPFGPFMIAGACLGIFVGNGLVDVYLRLGRR